MDRLARFSRVWLNPGPCVADLGGVAVVGDAAPYVVGAPRRVCSDSRARRPWCRPRASRLARRARSPGRGG